MNDFVLAVLLGIIEGLTEFLPVSSTAHLRIVEAFLHVGLSNSYWKMFSIVIQLGAILCLPIYFRDRIVELLRDFPHGKTRRPHDRDASTQPGHDCVRRHGDPGVSADQGDRQAS